MAKKMGLGRGLSAILPDVEEVVESVDQVSEARRPCPPTPWWKSRSGRLTRIETSRAKPV